jgi:hypothetical protein
MPSDRPLTGSLRPDRVDNQLLRGALFIGTVAAVLQVLVEAAPETFVVRSSQKQ